MINKAALKVLMVLGILFAFPTFLLGVLGSFVGQAVLFAVVGACVGLALDLFVFYLISGKMAMLGAKLFFNKNASLTARVFKHRGVLLDVEDTKDAIPVYPNQEDSKVTLEDVPPHQDMRSGRPFRFLVQDVPKEVDLPVCNMASQSI